MLVTAILKHFERMLFKSNNVAYAAISKHLQTLVGNHVVWQTFYLQQEDKIWIFVAFKHFG